MRRRRRGRQRGNRRIEGHVRVPSPRQPQPIAHLVGAAVARRHEAEDSQLRGVRLLHEGLAARSTRRHPPQHIVHSEPDAINLPASVPARTDSPASTRSSAGEEYSSCLLPAAFRSPARAADPRSQSTERARRHLGRMRRARRARSRRRPRVAVGSTEAPRGRSRRRSLCTRHPHGAGGSAEPDALESHAVRILS